MPGIRPSSAERGRLRQHLDARLMEIRTTRSKATFAAPFRLPEVEEVLPAGTYEIETDEQVIEGNEHTVFVRMATLLRVDIGGTSRTITISPDSLAAALENDRLPDLPG